MMPYFHGNSINNRIPHLGAENNTAIHILKTVGILIFPEEELVLANSNEEGVCNPKVWFSPLSWKFAQDNFLKIQKNLIIV